jgi:hypothetical protein
MRTHLYTSDAAGKPVPEPDDRAWSLWFEKNTSARVVAKTDVAGVVVSTVFLGLDHSFRASGRPVLWETMIFGGEHDQSQWRYDSADAAKRHHEAIVESLKAGRKPPNPAA